MSVGSIDWKGPNWVAQGSIEGASSTEQVIGITDIISEGPIAGLAKGGGSIYLNNDSLFTDEETVFASTVGLTASSVHTSGSQPNIVINDFEKQSFNWNPSPEELNTATRFICIHNFREFGDGVTSRSYHTDSTYSINSSSAAVGGHQAWQQPAGFNIIIDGDFSLFPTGAIVDKHHFTLQNIQNDDGLVTIKDPSSDRKLTGFPTNINSAKNQLTVKVLLPNLDNHQWLNETDANGNNKIIISLSVFNAISSINGNAITLTNNIGIFKNCRFSFTKPQYKDGSSANSYNRKVRSSTFQFVPGTKDQQPLKTLADSPGSSTVALPGLPQLELGVVQTITHTGAQAGEIDEIQLLFRYNSGLYTINTENGDKEAAGAGYVIKLETQGSIDAQGEISWDDQGFLDGNMAMTAGAYSLRNQLLNGYSGTQPGTGSPVNLQQVQFDQGVNTDVLVEGTPIFGHGGKHVGPVSFTHTINLEPFQPFSGFRLKVCRITASQNTTEDAYGRAHTWGNRDSRTKLGYRGSDVKKYQAIQAGGISGSFGIIKEKLNFPYTALANVTFSSRQFDSVPTRMYDCFGMLVKVPSNYTTREEAGLVVTPAAGTLEKVGSLPSPHRLYSGLFTGQFREEKVWTDNPAWIFYDILTNNRYGVGEFVETSDIDIYSLYKIARYCDELVADGKGGVEPRFRANLYLQKATDVYKVLKDMATIFRGMLYWMDGQLTSIMDEPKAPTYNFNRSNVIDGLFSYEHTGTKTRTNQVVVQWNNPENDYKLEPLFVEDRENIIKTGQIVKSESVAFGCTSEGQAIRYGRWKLWTALNQTEIVSFKSALNAAFIAPGDIVNIQDNHDYGFAFGGRISNASYSSGNTTITLDRDISVDPESGTDTDIGSAGTYTLALLVAERKVIAAKDCKIWDSSATPAAYKNFKKGDVVTKWWNGTTQIEVDQPSSWSNDQFEQYTADSWTAPTNVPAGEDEPVPLHLEYADAHRIQDVTCTANNPNGNVLTIQNPAGVPVFASQTEADRVVQGGIWALKDENETTASYKTYKVLNIVHEDDNTYAITAVEYFDTKFDIIETNFTTAVPDPLFPPQDPSSVLPGPRGLRVFRSPRAAEPGEELVIKWDQPAGEYAETVSGYSVSCNIPGILEEQTTAETFIEFTKVPDGKYTVSVQAYSSTGKKSRPVSATFFVYDVYGGTAERFKYVLKGGKVSAPSVITSDITNKRIKFEQDPLHVLSNNDTSTTGKSVAIGLGLDYDILGKFATQTWLSNDQLFNSDAYVLLTGYNSIPHLKLVNYVQDGVLGVDYWYDQSKYIQKEYNDNNVFNHYPANPDVWTQQNGLVRVENNSAKVIGVGTSFLTQYSATNLIKFNDGTAAKVAYIEDNNCLYIDRSFNFKTHTIQSAQVTNGNARYFCKGHDFVVGDYVTITGLSSSNFNSDLSSHHSKYEIIAVQYDQYSGTTGALTAGSAYFDIGPVSFTGSTAPSGSITAIATTAIGVENVNQASPAQSSLSRHYRDDLNINYSRDFLVGRITSGGTFTNYCTLDPDIGKPRAVILDSNFSTLNYNTVGTSGGTTTNELQSTYTDLTLTGIAIGFEVPQFKVTGDFLPNSAHSADTGFVDVTNLATGQFTKQIAGASSDSNEVPAFSSFPLEFSVIVREKFDPDNTAKQVTQTIKIFAVKDGASGSEGRTVSVLGNDSSVRYDSSNANPDPSSIVFTATPFNFPAPATNDLGAVVRFKDHAGNILQDWAGIDSNGVVTYTLNSSSQFVGTTTGLGYGEGRPSPDRRPKYIEAEASLDVSPRVVSATDSTPILYITDDSTGLNVSFPNNTYPINTASDGIISTSTLAGSGGTMEVFIGNQVGKYVGTNNGTANKDSAITLNPGEWYISDVQSSDTDLTAGNITYNGGASGDQIITIADAGFNTNGNGLDNSETITWTITGQNASTTLTTKVQQSLFKNKEGAQGQSTTGAPGEDAYSASGGQVFHMFLADFTGTVTNPASFSTSFVIKKGGTTYSHAASGTATGTYAISFQNQTNVTGTNNGAVISLNSNSTLFSNASTSDFGSMEVVFTDREDNTVITIVKISFAKEKQAVRDGADFTFNTTSAVMSDWKTGTLSVATRQAAAALVIGTMSNGVQQSSGSALDGHLNPNDVITLIHGSDVATRIYEGSRTNNSSSVGQFSSPITQRIDGSLLVDGTLSASSIAANTGTLRALTVGERITVGTSTAPADAKITSKNKSSSDPTSPGGAQQGFYMDGAGNFLLGDGSNYLKYTPGTGTGSGFQLAGTMDVAGPQGVSVTGASIDSTTGNLILTLLDGSTTSTSTVGGGAVRLKVVPIYASSSGGAQQDYDRNGYDAATNSYPVRDYVTFYEYSSASPPTLPLPANAATWVNFVGEDGGGVQPIYATSASGANANIDQTAGGLTRTFVNFREYNNVTTFALGPNDTIPSGLTYIEMEGSGTPGSSFITYDARPAGQPATDSDKTTAFTSVSGRAPVQNDILIIVYVAGGDDKSAQYRWNGTTWQSATLFITGDTIVDGTITATELQISSTDGTNAAGIHMDGDNERIDIYDAAYSRRVRLGKL